MLQHRRSFPGVIGRARIMYTEDLRTESQVQGLEDAVDGSPPDSYSGIVYSLRRKDVWGASPGVTCNAIE
jgi:hypothetical protein